MKTKTIIALTALIAVIAFAVGATGLIDLSSDENQDNSTQQRDLMVGVFVTTEYIDLFDIEGYLKDNIDNIAGSETYIQNSIGYEGRIYAVLKDETFTDELTGETVTTKEYVFEDLEGYPFFHCEITDENGTYGSTMSDDVFSNSHFASNYTDNGEEQSLEATIYYTDKLKSDVFYLNPVYQASDGRVYLMSGSGISSQGGGMTSSQLQDEVTVTADGKETTKKTTVKVNFEHVSPTKEILVTHMDSSNNKIRTDSLLPHELPVEFFPERGTDFLIVETVSEDGSERKIISKDETYFDVLKTRADGICIIAAVNIKW